MIDMGLQITHLGSGSRGNSTLLESDSCKVLIDSGMREWLDPRVADTDGDGLPDGYEIYMCTEGGLGYLNTTNAWTCLWFDPLDSSDMWEDIDRCADFTFWWYRNGV